MTIQIEAIIGKAEANGGPLYLSDRGAVKVHGDRVAVERWLPTLRQLKPRLVEALTASTAAKVGLDGTEGRAAVDLLSRAGAKILPHHLQTIAVAAHHDTPELRRALALLGYGAYNVAHLDTWKYRGQSIDVVEAALRAAGGLPC